ncbi:MAG TPA: glycosyltransferase family A protein [Candidatus Elarobacter sp.]
MTSLARRYAGRADVVVATPGTLGTAIPEMIERRRNGGRVDLALEVEEPRVALMRTVASQFLDAPSPDERAARFDMLANGQLALNDQPQNVVEEGWYGGAGTVAFQHACAIADRVVFRSVMERERCRRLFGERPARVVLGIPDDDRVPAPPAPGAIARGEHVALWAADVAPTLVAVADAMLWDLRASVRVVDDTTPGAARLLASARVIVALDPDDPAAAVALARYGVPLCATWTSGAAEYVDGIESYEPWNRITFVESVLRAFGGDAPRVRDASQAPLQPQPAVVRDRAPLVSIVMPTWNRPHDLRANLARLQQQTYPNTEIIVVNNAGQPVEDVVADFPGTLLVNRCENTGNSTMPRNDGYARSRGAFVTFLDDDDWYFPDHVAANVEALERTGAACAYSNFLVRLVRREADGTEADLGWDLERNPGITSFELLVANRIGYMTVFCRRSAIETVGPFDPEGLGGEEVEMWLRLAQRFDYVHLDRPTTAYTIRTNWSGQATAQNHHLFAGGYEYVYRRYAAAGLPHILAARKRYLTHLRSSDRPAARQPRYTVPLNAITPV